MSGRLRDLAEREKENIKGAKEDIVKKIQGERNPFKIYNEFINGINNVEEIYNTTLAEINRVNELKLNLASKPYIIVVLLSGFLIFINGVVLPLTLVSLNPIFYIHLPLFFYGFLYLIVIFRFAIS